MAIQDFDRFKTIIRGGMARTNQFQVIMHFPTSVSPYLSNDLEAAEVLVQSVTIPSVEVGEIIVPKGGKKLKLPGDRDVGDLVITYRADRNYNIHASLMAWQESLVGFDTQCRYDIFSDYTASIIVNSYYKSQCQDILTAQFMFNECWLKNLSEIELSETSENENVTFQATFAVTDFTYLNTAGYVNI